MVMTLQSHGRAFVAVVEAKRDKRPLCDNWLVCMDGHIIRTPVTGLKVGTN